MRGRTQVLTQKMSRSIIAPGIAGDGKAMLSLLQFGKDFG
jgi:hypothetical protein